MDPAPVACSACGTPNEPGARFCNACGQSMSTTCPACGTANVAGARFCNQCGTPFATDAAAARLGPTPAASSATAERRLVSVLFADLVGFTTLSEERDAEETRELLTRYFDLARGIIERHGGTVEKFIGDAVMAVWGAPTAHEDDAERAVRAAMELVGAVPAIGEGDDEPRMKARAGVLTGEAAVTIGATNQGMVAGDLVNTASRLQSAAAPGTVLVGEATYRAASNAIAFEPAGEQAMKGKVAPVPAWRAIAVVARRGGSGRTATLEPPFVGRDEELRLLKDLLDTTQREGKSRLATIVGQARIGKSRLTWEFEKYLDGVVDTVYWLEGRSPSYGEGISYWALVEMVRRRAGIAETDDGATARAKLMATLDEFITDPAERRWIEPRIAAVAPAVLVFTDLQWADQGMLDFIEDLLRWARTAPILVVAQARPELLERRPDFGSAVRSATRVTLEPLSDTDMRALLEGLVPGLPAAALRQIVERAEGIPLYAVETVRMLLDRELLVAEDGRYRLTGELPTLGVADTLHALIASRLDANLPEDRALLQDASVLGQSFTVEALTAVGGVDPSLLADRLERLVARQLLTVDADPRSPERGQYQFVQAVVREVAYASLAKADRRARHLAAARYLEGLGDEEAVGVLASHYLWAHQASRPGAEADALAAQARIALHAAAERAAALHSNRQAVGYLEQALTVTSESADQAALHLRASELGEAFDLDTAVRHAEAARALYRSLADAHGALRAATWLGRHQTSGKTEPQAIATFEEALAEAASIPDSPEYAAALAELSRVYFLTGRGADAVTTADRALELGGPQAAVRTVVEALINKGSALLMMGRMAESEAVLRGASAVADRHGLIAAALRARNNLVGVYADHDLREAADLLREGHALAVRMGSARLTQWFLIGLAGVSIQTGEWGAWMDEVEAIEEAETPHAFNQASFASMRSLLASVRGDEELADAEKEMADAAAATLDSQQVTASQALTDAYRTILRGDWAAAVRSGLLASADSNFTTEAAAVAAHAAVAGDLNDDLLRAVAVLHASPYRTRLSNAAIANAEGGLAAREGRWGEARIGYRQALELRRQAGNLLEEAITGLEWGALVGDADPEAAAAAGAGEAFFVERGGGKAAERFRAAIVPVKERALTAEVDIPSPAASRSGVPST
ncbi:MAG: adenylate/guanylate cyclase domain-containing protein [Candidatus Limnocylindria bacterium]